VRHYTRVDERTIAIDTRRFTIKISSGFEGYGFSPPVWFGPMYLGDEKFENRAYRVSLNVWVIYKISALFSLRGWNYYRWIDSFLDQLDASFSFERFIERIGWETACTVAKIFKRVKPPRNSGEADSLPGIIEYIENDPN
jgi:hypothetical protein